MEDKKIRPFTFEEAKEQIGKAVENKQTGVVTTINTIWPNGVIVSSSILSPIRFEKLLERYIFLDGNPCGVFEN